MANEDRSVWIVFNGEIYNHRELRRDLEARGHRFRTHSDTEAIVHAYEEYGDACVERLDGMFAFAIADLRRAPRAAGARSARQEAAVSRHASSACCTSPARSRRSRRAPLWNGELDLDALEGYLSLGYFVAPATAYRHVRKLEPAHTLSVERLAHHRSASTGTSSAFDTDTRAGRALLDEVDARLAAAVSRRLESEVPIGAFLSGGIDSGLVVSYMAEALGSRAGHGVGRFRPRRRTTSSSPPASRPAHFSTRHTHGHRANRNLDDVLDPIVRVVRRAVCGSVGDSDLLRQQDGAAARHGGAVGRRRRRSVWRLRRGATCRTRSRSKARAFMPGSAGRKAAAWLGARWPRSRAFPRPLRLGNVLENLGRDPAGAYYADLCFLKPQDARALLGKAPTRDPADSPVYEQVTRPYRECPSDSAVQRAQYADLKVYLPNDPLVKVDRMSMAHSLEIRCPLLDHRLVELAFRIPTRQQDAERPAEVAAARARRTPPAEADPDACRSAGSRRRSAAGWPGRTPSNSATTCSAASSRSRDIVDPRASRGSSRNIAPARRSLLCAVGGLDARALGAPGTRAARRRGGVNPCFAPSSSSSCLTVGWGFALQSPLYAACLYLWIAYFRPESWAWSDAVHDVEPVVHRRRVSGDSDDCCRASPFRFDLAQRSCCCCSSVMRSLLGMVRPQPRLLVRLLAGIRQDRSSSASC